MHAYLDWMQMHSIYSIIWRAPTYASQNRWDFKKTKKKDKKKRRICIINAKYCRTHQSHFELRSIHKPNEAAFLSDENQNSFIINFPFVFAPEFIFTFFSSSLFGCCLFFHYFPNSNWSTLELWMAPNGNAMISKICNLLNYFGEKCFSITNIKKTEHHYNLIHILLKQFKSRKK